MKTNLKLSRAFTLIELLVVIAIIGILSGVVIVSMSNIQESAKDSRIKSEMNQLRTAVEIYKASHSGDYTGLTEDSEVSALIDDITTQAGDAPTVSTSSNAYCFDSQLASTTDTWCLDSLGYSGIGNCSGYECSYTGTSGSSWSCGDSFTDSRDGNVYTTVQIGSQCWMSKNLAYLPVVHSNAEFAAQGTTNPGYGVYGYDGTSVSSAKENSNYNEYGVLYNWTAASTACPYGWHLPTDAEQYTLEDYYATGTCVFDRAASWTVDACDPAGTSLKSGVFNAKMAGYRSTDGSCYVGSNTYFWSSSEGGAGAWSRYLTTSYSTVRRYTYSKAYGFSVRCLLE